MTPQGLARGKPAYRPDIDGLRALAVMPVVLYHAGIAGFSGGYVGVDIFFVISGFLITAIIAREIEEQHFSVLHFYERRARRILPALFGLVGSVLVAASVLFLPGDFEDVPKSALSALLFSANLWFFTQSGYFQGAAETMPLLHTWSLGVEEQFYIVFPWALMLIALAARRWRNTLVCAGAIASLAWAVAVQDRGDGFAFYMLPTRAWELLAGSLLALGAVPMVRSRSAREAWSWTGIVLILFGVFAYDKQTVFPGLAALPPVLGAALLIHCAEGTAAGRMLSWKPAVWIGLLSYSLYLWHWPLIVFTEYAQDAPLSPLQSVGVVAVSMLIAWASLKWIETPWRDRKRHSRRGIFAMSTAGLALLGSACLVLVSFGSWASRFPVEVEQIAVSAEERSPVRDICLRTEFAPPDKRCTLGAAVAPDAMLWGDSHGVEYAWVLGLQAERLGQSIAQRTLGSCAPLSGFSDAVSPDCALFNKAVLAEIESDPSIRTVYLAGYWTEERYRQANAVARLGKTIAQLQALGRKVVLIGPVPTQPHDVPRALERTAAYDLSPPTPQSAARYRVRTAWFTDNYPRWRARGVTIVDPSRALFTGQESRIYAGGKVLYFDSHHLTLAGAELVLETDGAIDKGAKLGAYWDNR